MSINKVFVVGNITRDPEKRKAGEVPIISFGVAVNDYRKGGEQYTNFFDVTVFGQRAVKLSEILRKGMKIAIDGQLHYSQWENDGQKRSKVDITANNIEIMTAKGEKKAEETEEIPW